MRTTCKAYEPANLCGHSTSDAGPGAEAARRAGVRRYAAFALLAYMSTYSCPDSRITSVITESVTARST